MFDCLGKRLTSTNTKTVRNPVPLDHWASEILWEDQFSVHLKVFTLPIHAGRGEQFVELCMP